MPLLQTLPAAHVTPAQGSLTHVPPAQTCLPGQVTPAHALGATHVKSHANPVPHAPAQVLTASHLPVSGTQNCPAAHFTPLQGTSKQPATQSPSTQVSCSGHALPAHGSSVRTQVVWQVVPAAHVFAGAARQGSTWQMPPRQIRPPEQSAVARHELAADASFPALPDALPAPPPSRPPPPDSRSSGPATSGAAASVIAELPPAPMPDPDPLTPA
jgi:hypothetical protein